MCTLSKKSSLTATTICLQEEHGKDEFLQAIQVLAPLFRFFFVLSFLSENAGGSTISIRRDILLEEAIVTHLVTGHGRDHLVNIQSGRHNLVVVNVQLRTRTYLEAITSQVASYSPAVAFISQWSGHYFG